MIFNYFSRVLLFCKLHLRLKAKYKEFHLNITFLVTLTLWTSNEKTTGGSCAADWCHWAVSGSGWCCGAPGNVTGIVSTLSITQNHLLIISLIGLQVMPMQLGETIETECRLAASHSCKKWSKPFRKIFIKRFLPDFY